MLFDSDDFTLFGLPRRFSLDGDELDARRRSLQAEIHPDRFASSDAAARRLSLQWAGRVNEAFERLRNPLARAAYLCELNGARVKAEDNTAMPAEFLVQQMAWREALAEARSSAEVEAIDSDLNRQRRSAYSRLAFLLDVDRNFDAAVREVRALMFTERFAADVDDRLASLEA